MQMRFPSHLCQVLDLGSGFFFLVDREEPTPALFLVILV